MYRAPSKRRVVIQRTIIYSFMTIGVIALVTILVFVMLGYRFNRDTSKIIQGGLVQFASQPIDATVTIGKAKLADITPSKITVNPGSYGVTMQRSGYRTWNKAVNVRAGEVLWLNYAQLIPTSVKTEPLTQFTAISQIKSSPNGDRFAVLEDAAKPSVTFVDVTSTVPRRTSIAIPIEILPADTVPTFELHDWASDSDRMLVKMRYDNLTQWLLVDRRDAKKTINISSTYESDLQEVIFDPRSSQKLIARSSTGDVRLIDTAGGSQSGIVATKVSSMSLYGDDAIFMVRALSPGEQSVAYLSLGSSEPRELKKIQSPEPIKVAAGNYFNEAHLAITTGSQINVLKLESLPSSDSDSAIAMTSVFDTSLLAAPTYLSVRSSGRFVITQYPAGVQTYDVELDTQTLTSLPAGTDAELRWLDKYHFYLTNGTQLQVTEFDGGNPRQITALTTQFDSVQSDDSKYIFSFNKTDAGFALQRSQVVLDN